MHNESPLVRFAQDYGWRAYAIPVLAVITIWVIVDILVAHATSDGPPQAGEATTTSSAQTSSTMMGPDPARSNPKSLPNFKLPPGGHYTEKGNKTFHTVGKPGMKRGEGTEEAVRYIVEVEDGVETTSAGGDDAFASMVDATLSDPRSWTQDKRFSFEHVRPDDKPTMRIRIASAKTTAEVCGADLELETSCHINLDGMKTVMLNHSRWVRGAQPFAGDLGSYRQYLINHEVGHGIGYAQHEPCGEDGSLAPVMMQQTIGLNNTELRSVAPKEIYPDNNFTCRYNPWPYPVPGVEPVNQPDIK